MAVKTTRVQDFNVIYGLLEIGSLWIIQSRRIRLYTYGCKVYCNENLEAEFPQARATPWAYELEADGIVTWRIERSKQTWIDQPIKEIAKSSVGGLQVFSPSQDAFLQRNGDFYVYTEQDFRLYQGGAPINWVTSAPSPLLYLLPTTRPVVKIEGVVTTSTNERAFVNVRYHEDLVNPPYTFGKYWNPGGYDTFMCYVPAATTLAQVWVEILFYSTTAVCDLSISNEAIGVVQLADDLSTTDV
jgi:hypothetical protein